MTGWADLVPVAERELALARAARWEESVALAGERDALARTLGPAQPADRAAVQALLDVQDQLVVEYTLARDAAARELSSLSRGRGAVRGYRTATGRDARVLGAG